MSLQLALESSWVNCGPKHPDVHNPLVTDCWRAKQFLKRQGLEVEEVNIEAVPKAAEFIMSVNGGKRRVPTFEIAGRTFNCSPFDHSRLRRELGIT